MQIENKLYNSLQSLNNSLNNLLKASNFSPTDSKLERFLYTLAKKRFEIYEQVRFSNDITEGNEIHFIDNDYRATLKDDVLSLYIPEKLPNLKNRSSYAHKQIILNIAEITKPIEHNKRSVKDFELLAFSIVFNSPVADFYKNVTDFE